jgi:hypothetical protein
MEKAATSRRIILHCGGTSGHRRKDDWAELVVSASATKWNSEWQGGLVPRRPETALTAR